MQLVHRSAGRIWIVAICLAAGIGCGKPTATVTGKVTLNGAPVTAGAVTFHGEEKFVQSAGIDTNGTYSISNVPVGPVKVTVVPAQPRPVRNMPGKTAAKHPGDKGGPGAAAVVPIPEKYRDPSQSGLNYTLKSGEQTIDLPLQ
jgi:hypothetical protein